MGFLILTGAALFFLLVVLILLMTRPARADDIPIPCEQVRSLIAEHGKVKALAWAFEHGLSIRQIYLIRKTCKV